MRILFGKAGKMTKFDIQNYLGVVAICIMMCLGLKYVSRHVDSVASLYNANQVKCQKMDSRGQKQEILKKEGKK